MSIGVTLNQLAREQMKLKLLYDIRMDIDVCKLEGIDYRPYLRELKDIIDGFVNHQKTTTISKMETTTQKGTANG